MPNYNKIKSWNKISLLIFIHFLLLHKYMYQIEITDNSHGSQKSFISRHCVILSH